MTKNIFSLTVFVAAVSLILGSCRKYSPVENDQQVGISKITYYATITLNGDSYMSVAKGETFTDPGATATANGQDLPVTASGTVNTNTVGIYTITYSALNKDGFPATNKRTVGVIPAHEVPGTDISGTYYYIATPTATSTVAKVAEGFYTTTNFYSGSTTIPGVFFCSDGATITIPNQSTPYGGLYGTGTLTTDGALTYIISLPDQGNPALINLARKWHRQ